LQVNLAYYVEPHERMDHPNVIRPCTFMALLCGSDSITLNTGMADEHQNCTPPSASANQN
ncbi:hypothetical protein BV898_20321, partial [Hypsibius exemplaris]